MNFFKYLSSNLTLDFKTSFFKNTFRWLLLKFARCYSAIYVFSSEVTGNANLLQKVQHQKVTCNQKITNLHALWLKMPRHISNVLDFYGKTEESREAIIREKIICAFKSYFNNLEETQIHNILFITTKF